MFTRKKSSQSRNRRARRQQSKFLTPDLALCHGQILRFVPNEDSPLSEAERLRGEFAEMAEAHEAAVRRFLQRVYFVALQFRRQRGEFERLQVHPFWKASGQKKPPDPSTSKWVLYLIMQATTLSLRSLADQYAVILDGLMQDQLETGAVALRIKALGGIDAAHEAMRMRKPVSGTVAETAAAARRTRRPDQSSPGQIGKSPTTAPTQPPRRRRPKPTFPVHPLVAPLFDEEKFRPHDEWLAGEEGKRGRKFENVPAEAAFDFVQRLAREYAQIQEGDHRSVRRVLQRAYLAALKMQRESDQFARLQATPFWKGSFHHTNDASSSKWVVYFVLQARTPPVRFLAAQYTALLDRLLRDQVDPLDKRIGKMAGIEAAYQALQARQRLLRELKSRSRRQGGRG